MFQFAATPSGSAAVNSSALARSKTASRNKADANADRRANDMIRSSRSAGVRAEIRSGTPNKLHRFALTGEQALASRIPVGGGIRYPTSGRMLCCSAWFEEDRFMRRYSFLAVMLSFWLGSF